MSSVGFKAEGVSGSMTQEECDRLHFIKNRPSVPEVNGLPISFPPYTYQALPCALYGPWTDDTKRAALKDLARQIGLDLRDDDDREECESRLPAWDTKLATTEREHQYWLAKGWADSPDDVEKKQQAIEAELGTQAAHRNWDDRNLGERARAEMKAIDEAAETFVPEIPETPIRRGPGRPRKEPSDVA